MKQFYGKKWREYEWTFELWLQFKLEVYLTVLHSNEIGWFYLNFDRVEFVVRHYGDNRSLFDEIQQNSLQYPQQMQPKNNKCQNKWPKMWRKFQEHQEKRAIQIRQPMSRWPVFANQMVI